MLYRPRVFRAASFLLWLWVSPALGTTSVYVQNNTYMELAVRTETALRAQYWRQTATRIPPGQRARILEFNRDTGITHDRRFYFNTTLSQGPARIMLKQQLRGERINSHMWQSLEGPGFSDPWHDDRRTHTANWSLPDGRSIRVLYRAYPVEFSEDDIEYVLQEPNITAPGPSNTLSLLTYNVFLRPEILFTDGQANRSRLIPRQLSGYDVIVFQEAFDDSARRELLKRLRAEYPYQTNVLGRDHVYPFEYDGGVVIVSRWPFAGGDERYFGDVCSGTDCLAAKGVLYVVVNKNGRKYHIFGTHLNAGNWEVQSVQLRIMRDFIDSKRINRGEPVIMAGDFNVDRANAVPRDFNKLLETLDATAPPQSGPPYSSDGLINKLVEDDKRRTFDYVLYSNRHAVPSKSYNFVRLIRSPEQYPKANVPNIEDWYKLPSEAVLSIFKNIGPKATAYWDLSDHFPVQGHFVFPRDTFVPVQSLLLK